MKKIQFKTDTGAQGNVLPERYLCQIMGSCPLLPTKQKLYGNGSEELKVQVQGYVRVSHILRLVDSVFLMHSALFLFASCINQICCSLYC